MQCSQLKKTCFRVRLEPVTKREKSIPRANRLSYEFNGCGVANIVYRVISFINQIGKITLPFQYFTYFDEHKLTGVMVTSQSISLQRLRHALLL